VALERLVHHQQHALLVKQATGCMTNIMMRPPGQHGPAMQVRCGMQLPLDSAGTSLPADTSSNKHSDGYIFTRKVDSGAHARTSARSAGTAVTGVLRLANGLLRQAGSFPSD
jgi:hypothetical protein